MLNYCCALVFFYVLALLMLTYCCAQVFFCVHALLMLNNCCSQVFVPWQQKRRAEQARLKFIKVKISKIFVTPSSTVDQLSEIVDNLPSRINSNALGLQARGVAGIEGLARSRSGIQLVDLQSGQINVPAVREIFATFVSSICA
jgi:hypothetical protein